jgi:LacI family transcriptional regulator, galactose operon repressor
MITIKDLAKTLKVSPSTISMALNDNPRVSEKTRKKVKELAKKLRYRPNLIARAMVQKKTHLIGLIISDIMSSFFPQIIQGIEDVISKKDYSAILCPTNGSPAQERQYLNLLREKQVDGIIADPVECIDNKDLWQEIKEKNIPLITILNEAPVKNIVNIKVDNIAGGILATEHLIKDGHKIIGHLSGPECFQISKDRLEGFKIALKNYHLKCRENLIIETSFDWEAGYNNMRLMMQKKPRPTAVFCAGDIIAIGASFALRQSGFRVPDDIAIIGFDDLFLASIAEIPLTTIAQPKYHLGSLAAEKLMNLINKNKEESEILQPTLTLRDSCGLKCRKSKINKATAASFKNNYQHKK